MPEGSIRIWNGFGYSVEDVEEKLIFCFFLSFFFAVIVCK